LLLKIQSELTNGLVLEVDLLLLDLHPHPLLQILVEGEGVDIPGGRVADPDSIGSVDPDPDPESGSRRAKMTHKSIKKFKSSFFEVLDGLF
jgi:hypothetical protein